MNTKIYIATELKIVYGYQEMMLDIHVKINPGLPLKINLKMLHLECNFVWC